LKNQEEVFRWNPILIEDTLGRVCLLFLFFCLNFYIVWRNDVFSNEFLRVLVFLESWPEDHFVNELGCRPKLVKFDSHQRVNLLLLRDCGESVLLAWRGKCSVRGDFQDLRILSNEFAQYRLLHSVGAESLNLLLEEFYDSMNLYITECISI
jgi:hypothetical protein